MEGLSLAARWLVELARSPKGPMDKMILEGLPTAAEVLVELVRLQEQALLVETTTSLVEDARELFKISRSRLINEINPKFISDSLREACADAAETLTAMAVPVDLTDRNSSSYRNWRKVMNRDATLLSPLTAHAILCLVDSEKPEIVDLSDIKVVNNHLGDDTVKRFVFDGGPTRMENAKIAVIQFQIEEQVERNYILGMIKATGCNTLVIPKTCIFRDDDLSILAQAKIMVIKDVERQEIEFLTEILKCLPIANIEQFGPDMLGQAHLVEQVSLENGMILNIGVVKDMWTSTSLLVRAPRHLALCTIHLHVSSKPI